MRFGNQPVGTVAYLGGVLAVPEEFTWAWGQMIQFNSECLCAPGEYVHMDRAKVSYHVSAQNMLADRFLGDWLVQFDTDHQFEPDIVARLATIANTYRPDDQEIEVLTGVYCFKGGRRNPVLYVHDRKTDTFQQLAVWPKEPRVVRVGAAGAGILFVRRRVFERIRAELGEQPFDVRGGLSEDLSFFRRLIQLRIPAWCATAVESFHLALEPVRLADQNVDGMQLITVPIEGA
jgi:hypothetical protein